MAVVASPPRLTSCSPLSPFGQRVSTFSRRFLAGLHGGSEIQGSELQRSEFAAGTHGACNRACAVGCESPSVARSAWRRTTRDSLGFRPYILTYYYPLFSRHNQGTVELEVVEAATMVVEVQQDDHCHQHHHQHLRERYLRRRSVPA